MFWKIMKKGGGGEPSGGLADAIKSAFGSFADFKNEIRGGRSRPVWFRLGLAYRERRQAGDRVHA